MKGNACNTLVIDSCASDPNKKLFTYFVPLSNAPDNRTWVIPVRFSFALSNERASQLVDEMKDKADLMEDIFQNVYPGFTGEGKAERFIVNKLKVIDDIVTRKEEGFMSVEARKRDRNKPVHYNNVVVKSRSRILNFSKPVGEIAS